MKSRVKTTSRMAYGSTYQYGVISGQPRSSSRFNGQRETHYNGEQIIFEAACDADHLKKDVRRACCCCLVPHTALHLIYTIVAILKTLGLYLIMCLMYIVLCGWPCGCLCGKRVAGSWRLLLTRSRIYYMHKHACCLCRSYNTNLRIDLDDVGNIYVQNAKVSTGYFSPSAIVPTTVVAELKQGRRFDLLPHKGSWLARRQSTNPVCVKVYFVHCANAEEFVQAVRHQIESVQTFGY